MPRVSAAFTGFWPTVPRTAAPRSPRRAVCGQSFTRPAVCLRCAPVTEAGVGLHGLARLWGSD